MNIGIIGAGWIAAKMAETLSGQNEVKKFNKNKEN